MEEGPQRPEAATHPSAVIFWRARAEKRKGKWEVMEERGDGGELSQVDTYLSARHYIT